MRCARTRCVRGLLCLSGFNRRKLLIGATGLAFGVAPARAAAAFVSADAARAPSFEPLAARAQELARTPFASLDQSLPAAFAALDYDSYRRLRPRPETSIWADTSSPYAVLPLPRGSLYRDPVSLRLVSAEGVSRTDDGAAHFDFVDFPQADATARAGLGVSGWRLMRREAQGFSEHAVFQGGVYFRAVAEGLRYGISARALSLFTGRVHEEFPHFREFTILQPRAGDASLSVFALLDSPSLTGAYAFVISPGDRATTIRVRAALYPRVDVEEVGLAAMSSMFARGKGDAVSASDARPQIHDSDGLAVHLADGETVWRPLSNPKRVEISQIRADELRGFGLLQRARDASLYQDTEALYEARPSLWVRPTSAWGAGHVILVELPTSTEYNDNIAALWRPAQPLRAGERYDFAYDTIWNDVGPSSTRNVRAEASTCTPTDNGAAFAIDFTTGAGELQPRVLSQAGEIRDVRFEQLTPRLSRLSFSLANADAGAELSAALFDSNDTQVSETWLYRWTHD